MQVAVLVLVCLTGNRGFSVKSSPGPASPEFRYWISGEANPRYRALLAAGRQTGIVVPDFYVPYTIGFDVKGRPVGGVTGVVSGALTLTLGTVIMFRDGKYRAFKPLPKFPEARCTMAQGNRFVGVAFTPGGYTTDEPRDSNHGFLLADGRATDLGPAMSVAFRKDGSIEGFFVGDSKGRPYNLTMVGESYRHRFVWNKGVRLAVGRPELITD